MKLEDVKSKIDDYFDKIDPEELYRKSIDIYKFVDLNEDNSSKESLNKQSPLH